MDLPKLKASIERNEGFSALPYPDRGKVSIGFGRNLTDYPLTREEGWMLSEGPLNKAINDAPLLTSKWSSLNSARQNVLIEMVYNLGLRGVLGFKMTRAAIDAGDFAGAAKQMRDSMWATQVGARAERLATQMETGEFV